MLDLTTVTRALGERAHQAIRGLLSSRRRTASAIRSITIANSAMAGLSRGYPSEPPSAPKVNNTKSDQKALL